MKKMTTGLKLNIIINHLVVVKVQIQEIHLSILLAIVALVRPWNASGSKNTVHARAVPVWLLGVARFMKIVV